MEGKTENFEHPKEIAENLVLIRVLRVYNQRRSCLSFFNTESIKYILF